MSDYNSPSFKNPTKQPQSPYHIPVMLAEVIEGLKITSNGWYIDCNLGGGGHTEGILKMGGKVLGIDLDAHSINEVSKNHDLQTIEKDGSLTAISDHLILFQANFANIQHIVNQLNLNPIRGILFDLGVSSHQLEEGDRGFSFNVDAPLDMRMNQNDKIATAADLVNGLHEGELAELFWKLGEENFSRPIAKRIVDYRKIKKIETTNELAKVIVSVRRRTPSDRTHPATRVFQALRIAVNDELNSLKAALPASFECLEAGGRLVVISFHSLEDRIVKDYFRRLSDSKKAILINQKPITPTDEEVYDNPRARSGKLRILEKI